MTAMESQSDHAPVATINSQNLFFSSFQCSTVNLQCNDSGRDGACHTQSIVSLQIHGAIWTILIKSVCHNTLFLLVKLIVSLPRHSRKHRNKYVIYTVNGLFFIHLK